MASPETQKLADKIASLLEAEVQPRAGTGDIASLYASLEKLNHRLDKLEQAFTKGPTEPVRLPGHPSLDKFAVAEAIADEIFAGVNKEKACQFEPDKPCDHCSMCNSRGF